MLDMMSLATPSGRLYVKLAGAWRYFGVWAQRGLAADEIAMIVAAEPPAKELWS